MTSTTPSKSTYIALSLSQLSIPVLLLATSMAMKRELKPGPLGNLTPQALYMVAGVLLLGSMALAITKLKWPAGPVEDPEAATRAGFQSGVIASSLAELPAMLAFVGFFMGWLTAMQAMPVICGTMVAILGVTLPRGLAFLNEAEKKR